MRLKPIGPVLDRLRGQTSLRELEAKIGDHSISASTLSRLFRSTENKCRLQTLDLVANGIGMPLSEIIKEAETGSSQPPGFKICPVISNSQAVSLSENPVAEVETKEWIPMPKGASGYCFGLHVSGESMISNKGDKSYHPGEIIIVDPTKNKPEEGSMVIARIDDSNTCIFKKMAYEDGEIVFLPLNPQFKTIYPKHETVIVGTVIAKCDSSFAFP